MHRAELLVSPLTALRSMQPDIIKVVILNHNDLELLTP
jgi:hypothetical protein